MFSRCVWYFVSDQKGLQTLNNTVALDFIHSTYSRHSKYSQINRYLFKPHSHWRWFDTSVATDALVGVTENLHQHMLGIFYCFYYTCIYHFFSLLETLMRSEYEDLKIAKPNLINGISYLPRIVKLECGCDLQDGKGTRWMFHLALFSQCPVACAAILPPKSHHWLGHILTTSNKETRGCRAAVIPPGTMGSTLCVAAEPQLESMIIDFDWPSQSAGLHAKVRWKTLPHFLLRIGWL